MTDAQIVAIAITVLAVLGGTLINNSRIGDFNNRFADLNSSLNSRFADTNRKIDDLKELLRAEIKASVAETRASIAETNGRLTAMDTKLDAMLRLLADVDQRVSKLESR
jgi:low affinity Fe/Cu permease